METSKGNPEATISGIAIIKLIQTSKEATDKAKTDLDRKAETEQARRADNGTNRAMEEGAAVVHDKKFK